MYSETLSAFILTMDIAEYLKKNTDFYEAQSPSDETLAKANDYETYHQIVKYVWDGEELTMVYNETVFVEKIDNRAKYIFTMLQKTFAWIKTEDPEFYSEKLVLYFWISDRVPWEFFAKDEKGCDQSTFPFMVVAAPMIYHLYMFPETTFECMTLDVKYSDSCLDWDQTKTEIAMHVVDPAKKENRLYFKGANTGRYRSKLRAILFKHFQKQPQKRVTLEETRSGYEPIYNWSKFAYLVDLPGHYEWSNRFKYLFLCKSVVIHVDLTIIDTRGTYTEPPFRSFVDFFIKPDRDYINIPMKLYNYNYLTVEGKGAMSKEQARFNTKAFSRLIVKLIEISNTPPDQYSKVRDSGYNAVKGITNDTIYRYIYDMMRSYKKLNPIFKME